MPHLTVALECALPREASPLFSWLGARPSVHAGIRWAGRELDDVCLIIAEAGMGTTNAAATAQFLCDRFEPAALIFYGIAGGLNPELGVGDVVVGSHVCRLEADMEIIAESEPGLESFSSDERLVECARQELGSRGFSGAPSVEELAKEDGQEALEALPFGLDAARGPRYVAGTVATSDLFDTDEAILRALRKERLADCEEMEGAGAAQIAARAGVPFLALRSLSNVCGESYDDLDHAEERLNVTARTAAEAAAGVARRFAKAADA